MLGAVTRDGIQRKDDHWHVNIDAREDRRRRYGRVRDDGELGEEWVFELENDTVVRMWRNSQYYTKVR